LSGISSKGNLAGSPFRLAELTDIFKTRDAGGTFCDRVFELAQIKLAGIDADIISLKQTRRYLIKVLAAASTDKSRSKGAPAAITDRWSQELTILRRRTMRSLGLVDDTHPAAQPLDYAVVRDGPIEGDVKRHFSPSTGKLRMISRHPAPYFYPFAIVLINVEAL
jgi:hypothetical protein